MAKGKGRVILVSNRLPVTIERRKGQLRYRSSIGGLATGLSAFFKRTESLWVGWPGIGTRQRDEISERLYGDFRCVPVFLTEKEVKKFYYGFCNETVWPLFHFFPKVARYDLSSWEYYMRVNRHYADAALRVARPGDTIWVHDYHLMLVPAMIRQSRPRIPVGFFLHIPFPSIEIYRLLPWRREVLQGLLGADLIGFHTHEYSANFLNGVLNLLGIDHELGRLQVGSRTVMVDVFPLGVDFRGHFSAAGRPRVKREVRRILKKIGDRQVIFSIDRLDYTKGIPERLEAFDDFITRNPYWRERLSMIMVVSPSRLGGRQYQTLKERIDQTVGRINGKHGTVRWTPIIYIHQKIPNSTLSALYSLADVALITPLRDGMNLIAKEYIASRPHGRGVLILSEMAGAAKELNEALIINPNSKEEIAQAIKTALEMPESDMVARNRAMQDRLRRNAADHWGTRFLARLSEVKRLQKVMEARVLDRESKDIILRDYRRARSRLLLLDYDGTLVPFAPRPEGAVPGEALLDLLRRLAAARGNEVALISGRPRETLQEWFGQLDLSLVAEHGVWLRRHRTGRWTLTETQNSSWKNEVRPVFRMFQDRVPGSLMEEKSHSLAWHYRTVESQTGISQARELLSVLTQMAANLEISVIHGNRVIEIKNVGASKGKAALRILQKATYDFILAIGDDLTDETMFRALPPQAHSIKVGVASSYAKYNFRGQHEVRPFLEGLAGAAGATGKRKKTKKGYTGSGPGPAGRKGKGG